MKNDSADYLHRLYPLQDRVLRILKSVPTGFYLAGGTAASRGYLNHRYSDDLDFFVNDSPDFALWAERVSSALVAEKTWAWKVLVREQRFFRGVVVHDDVSLKIEMINDVPAHVGEILDHAVLGRLDSAENILANKVTAVLDRHEPKDLADIWGFCRRMRLSLSDALSDAQSKAAGVFAPDLARVLLSASEGDWKMIRWTTPPDARDFVESLHALGEGLILP